MHSGEQQLPFSAQWVWAAFTVETGRVPDSQNLARAEKETK